MRKERLLGCYIGVYGGSSHEGLGAGTHLGKAMQAHQVPPQFIKQYLQQAPTYWGEQPFTAGAMYFGAVICFLFVLGLGIVDKKYKNSNTNIVKCHSSAVIPLRKREQLIE